MNIIGNIFYPEQFTATKIRIHPSCEEELKNIVDKSGCIEKFAKIFRLRIKHLEDYWKLCIQKKDWFESLRKAPGLYSMRFKNLQINLRIIFAFADYKDCQIVLLLCAFKEKESNDYISAIENAYNRIGKIDYITINK
jgi:hypothetical protein